MSKVLTYRPNQERLHRLLLELAGARSKKQLTSLVVEHLSGQPGVVAVRVWLQSPGKNCTKCPQMSGCRDHSFCLKSESDHGIPGAGEQSRIPLNLGPVAKGFSTPVYLESIERLEGWIEDGRWFAEEQIRAFAAHPIADAGVLGVLTRIPLGQETRAWLGWIAGHLAAGLKRPSQALVSSPGGIAHSINPEDAAPYRTQGEMRELEKENLVAALHASKGRVFGKNGAAELLGMKPTTLASRIKTLGISRRAIENEALAENPIASTEPGLPT